MYCIPGFNFSADSTFFENVSKFFTGLWNFFTCLWQLLVCVVSSPIKMIDWLLQFLNLDLVRQSCDNVGFLFKICYFK